MRVPSYRLHKPSGRAVVTLNGRDHYLGRFNTRESKSAYKRLISEWQSAGQGTSFGVSAKSITLAMLASDYLDHCEAYYPPGPSSETDQNRYAIKFASEFLPTPACEFGPLRLKAVRERMLQARISRNGRPYSRKYINKMCDRIKRMFAWGAEQELVDTSVYQALRNVRALARGRTSAPEADKVRPVPDASVDATIALTTPIVADMVRLQQLTGMRPGEVCCITPGMIDRSEDIWLANLPEHKTAWRGKDRLIYVGPKAQEVLAKYLDRGRNTQCFSPAESVAWRNSQRVRKTPENQGNRPGYSSRIRARSKPRKQPSQAYTTQSYGKAIKYACAKAFPLPEGANDKDAAAWRKQHWWSPNQLRHSAATRIRKECGLEAAQVLLGHSRADVTQIYAETNKDLGLKIAAQIG